MTDRGDNVRCDGCGIEFDPNKAGLAYNMGAGPEYFCVKCVPPGTMEQTMATIKTFMGFK